MESMNLGLRVRTTRRGSSLLVFSLFSSDIEESGSGRLGTTEKFLMSGVFFGATRDGSTEVRVGCSWVNMLWKFELGVFLSALLGRMEREDARIGLATMCIGVGQGTAMLLERV